MEAHKQDSAYSESKRKGKKFERFSRKIDPMLMDSWDKIQRDLKTKIIEEDRFSFSLQSESPDFLRFVGGTDISASKLSPDIAVACVVVIDLLSWETVWEGTELVHVTQPYVPGFLAFREVAHLKKLLLRCKSEKPEVYPQVVITDGNGILHPNECGLACHLGVLLDLPTIGSGKTFFDKDGFNKGDIFEIKNSKVLRKPGDHLVLRGNSGRVWAAAYLSGKGSTDMIFVSIGHKITLRSAIEVMNLCCAYRVPEPVRRADKISRELIGAVGMVDAKKLPTNEDIPIDKQQGKES